MINIKITSFFILLSISCNASSGEPSQHQVTTDLVDHLKAYRTHVAEGLYIETRTLTEAFFALEENPEYFDAFQTEAINKNRLDLLLATYKAHGQSLQDRIEPTQILLDALHQITDENSDDMDLTPELLQLVFAQPTIIDGSEIPQNLCARLDAENAFNLWRRDTVDTAISLLESSNSIVVPALDQAVTHSKFLIYLSENNATYKDPSISLTEKIKLTLELLLPEDSDEDASGI